MNTAIINLCISVGTVLITLGIMWGKLTSQIDNLKKMVEDHLQEHEDTIALMKKDFNWNIKDFDPLALEKRLDEINKKLDNDMRRLNVITNNQATLIGATLSIFDHIEHGNNYD